MKQKLLYIIISLLSTVCVYAYDFKAKNADGVIIYYNKNSGGCEVTYKNSSYNSYSGDIKIPSRAGGLKVTSIGQVAFQDCSDLTSIEIPNTIKTIDRSAFRNCVSLSSIEIPNSVTSIGSSAFNNCISLKNIDIPNSVSSIGISAFEGCISLISIRIPRSVSSINGATFYGCKSLTSFYGDYASNDGRCLIINNELIAFAPYNLITYTIPNTVTSIGSFAFCGYCLNSVNIPNTVTTIGDSAFFNCTALCSIDIPNSVISIGNSAFRDCTSLQSVRLGNSLSYIGNYAFYNCISLSSLVIPNSVTSIGDYAFNSCKSLHSINFLGSINKIGWYAFDGCNKLDKVYIENNNNTPLLQQVFKNSDNLIVDSTISNTFKDDFSNNNILTEAPINNNQKHIGSNISEPKVFPNLSIDKIEFADNGNNIIEAGEKCSIILTITNSGKGAARGCIIKVSSASAPDIAAKDVRLQEIAPGKTITQTIDINAGLGTANGKAQFSIAVDEPNGMGTDPVLLAVETKAFEAPKIMVADYSITGAQGAILSKKVPFDLQVLIQNQAVGNAEDVMVSVSLPQNVYLIEGNETTKIGKLSGGDTYDMNISLLVNNNYSESTIPVKLTLREKHGKYAENKTIDLHLNQTLATNKIDVKAVGNSTKNEIVAASIQGKVQQSDVDINIPTTKQSRPNTFALVFGIENYRNVKQNVPFAINDAQIMAQYLINAIGLPQENVHIAIDATRNEMIGQMDWLKKVAKVYPGCNIILYYSGHGMPDEATRASMLIPSDGYSSNKNTCYGLSSLYDELAEMNAANVTVIIDACFSGADREDGMLLAAKAIGLMPRCDIPSQGSMIVLSASQGDETAFHYSEKSHGMFTYFLLKKLQDSNGVVTMGELSDYVTDQVGKRSIIVNNKSQTPNTIVSPSIENKWRNLRW